MAYIFKKVETIYYVVPGDEAHDIQSAREVLENTNDLINYIEAGTQFQEDINQQPFTYHGEIDD